MKTSLELQNNILNIIAREIIDSRGYPTVECDIRTFKGLFRAMVPSGASTGIYEAYELRDDVPSRFLGKGVLKAVENVNTIIKQSLLEKNCTKQREIDEEMVINLDGS